jgi:transglutaminase-like putative cysteine protease
MKTVKKSLLRLALVLAVLAALCCTAFAIENFHVNSKQELVDVLSEQLEDRVTNFSVTYDGDYLDLVDRYLNPDLSLLLRQLDATEPNPDSSGPDYNTLNLKSAAAGVLDHVLYFSFTYFTSQKQEQALDAQCAAILKSLDLDGQSDYVKVRTIYEYVGLNFLYDDTLSVYHPYFGLKTGTMVCQGYSLLLYKLLWQSGIPNRILVGDGGGEPHSWNIVKLNGSWYNLDVTWDAAQGRRAGHDLGLFPARQRELPRAHGLRRLSRTSAYRSSYPVSSSDYDAPRITLSIKGSAVQSLMLRLNTPVQLVSSVSGCTFVSTDPSIVSVDQDGNLTAHKDRRLQHHRPHRRPLRRARHADHPDGRSDLGVLLGVLRRQRLLPARPAARRVLHRLPESRHARRDGPVPLPALRLRAGSEQAGGLLRLPRHRRFRLRRRHPRLHRAGPVLRHRQERPSPPTRP